MRSIIRLQPESLKMRSTLRERGRTNKLRYSMTVASAITPRFTPSSPGYLNDLLVRIAVSLQLTATQYREAVRHYQAVAKYLSEPGGLVARYAPDIFPQGSLRIGTTVRPIGRDEYDLDLVLALLALFGTADPVWVLDLVERQLRAHGTYGPMVERMNRCVRLNFAGQFHLDILPARPDGAYGDTFLLVPDRRLEEWKPSNPKGYAAWFEAQSAYRRVIAMQKAIEPLPQPEGAEDKTPLQLVVQLLKRWRDVRYDDPDLAPISIVLTTLAGHHYLGEEDPLQALIGIVRRIEAAIPPPGQRLVVCNPAHPAEDLSERWDRNPAAYRAFVTGIRDLNSKLTTAPSLEGLPRLREFLEDLFGDAAPSALRDQARAIEDSRTRGGLTLLGTASGLSTVAARGATPVRNNTFYD